MAYPNSKQRSVYTQSNFRSYDNRMSALSATLITDSTTALMLKVSPVLQAMVGKDPKKGEKVYDYDNAINYMIDPNTAYRLSVAAEYLLENIENGVKEVVVRTTDNPKNYTEYCLWAPNFRVLNGNRFNNFVIRCTRFKDGNRDAVSYHPFENGSFSISAGEDPKNLESSVMELPVGFRLFINILKQVVDNQAGFWKHGPESASSGRGNARGRNNDAYNVVEGDEESGQQNDKGVNDIEQEFDED